jgi:hypothetical protein
MYDKYIKYKTKYLALKRQLGGLRGEDPFKNERRSATQAGNVNKGGTTSTGVDDYSGNSMNSNPAYNSTPVYIDRKSDSDEKNTKYIITLVNDIINLFEKQNITTQDKIYFNQLLDEIEGLLEHVLFLPVGDDAETYKYLCGLVDIDPTGSRKENTLDILYKMSNTKFAIAYDDIFEFIKNGIPSSIGEQNGIAIINSYIQLVYKTLKQFGNTTGLKHKINTNDTEYITEIIFKLKWISKKSDSKIKFNSLNFINQTELHN